MFIGIKNKEPVLKVAETHLIETFPNILEVYKKGGDNLDNRDVFLAPE